MNLPITLPVVAAAIAGVPAGALAAAVVRTNTANSRPPGRVLMMAAATGLFVWAALTVTGIGVLAASLALAWTLLCLSAIDLITMRLPDVLTLPLLTAGLVVTLALPGAPVLDHAAGAAIAYGIMALLAWAYRRVRGMDGMGLGDAKLLAAAGAWLGWRCLPSVLVIACAIAFVWIAIRRLAGGVPMRGAAIAFGAPIAASLWIVWLYGPLSF